MNITSIVLQEIQEISCVLYLSCGYIQYISWIEESFNAAFLSTKKLYDENGMSEDQYGHIIIYMKCSDGCAVRAIDSHRDVRAYILRECW